jgi:hypothetical protein
VDGNTSSRPLGSCFMSSRNSTSLPDPVTSIFEDFIECPSAMSYLGPNPGVKACLTTIIREKPTTPRNQVAEHDAPTGGDAPEIILNQRRDCFSRSRFLIRCLSSEVRTRSIDRLR